MRKSLSYVLLLTSLLAPVHAQNELGKELLRQVRQCIGGLISNPSSASAQEIQRVSQECMLNYVMLGPDGQPPADLEKRLSAFLKATGVKIPHRTGQGQTTLTLELYPDENIFIVPVTIGGQPGKFLLDTGAGSTVIADSFARKLRLLSMNLPTSMLQQGVIGSECSSDNISIAIHPLPLVNIGKATVKGLSGLGLSADFIPGNLTGSLGIDFLSAFDFVIDPKKKQLQLLPPTTKKTIGVPLVGKSGLLTAQVYLNGQGPFTFGLDTGASQGVIAERVIQKLGLTPSAEKKDILGFCGLEKASTVQLDRFGVKDHEVKALEAVVYKDSFFDRIGIDGLIGQNFLLNYRQYWHFQGVNDLGMVQGGTLQLSQP